jgi:hypothetical protein
MLGARPRRDCGSFPPGRAKVSCALLRVSPRTQEPPELLGPDGEPWLLTPEMVAVRLSVSRSRVCELLNEDLPSITIGRSRRSPADGLRRWLLTTGA